jgi:hypothetical protein
LAGYANAASGYTLEYVPTEQGFGTGSKVNVKQNETVVEVHEILIYGDINGDGNIDSLCAGTAVDVENYIIEWDSVEDAVFIEAGDLNSDGNIDSMDAGIMVDAENYVLEIDQVTGLVK